MIVDRRTTLAGMLSGAAMGAAPASAFRGSTAPTLVIDSRRFASRAFMARAGGARIIDIAAPDAPLWEEIRAFRPDGGPVRGLTRWSDWVILRGLLHEKGLRVRAEAQADPAATGDAALFIWEMA